MMTYSLCPAVSDISDAIKLLNSELEILDFNHVTQNASDHNETVVQLINLCYELALSLKRTTAKINEKTEELIRLNSTMKSNQKDNGRAQDLLIKREEKLEDLENKLKIRQSQICNFDVEKKTMKKEIFKLQHALDIQKIQHEHEVRRKDTTISKLKNKIYESFSNEIRITDDKSKNRKSNYILPKHYDEIFDRYVGQLHNNIQIALTECATYRKLLEDIYEKITTEMADCHQATWENLSDLPGHLVVKLIEKNFQLFLLRLSGHL